jgi:ABC-type sugar transport system ATPase subunit
LEDLSGGNKQKVVIAKWIKNNSDLLMACSPTRGVDVGVKYEIYKFLELQKNESKAILLTSDELPELIGMCDRIYTLKNGEIPMNSANGRLHRGRQPLKDGLNSVPINFFSSFAELRKKGI